MCQGRRIPAGALPLSHATIMPELTADPSLVPTKPRSLPTQHSVPGGHGRSIGQRTLRWKLLNSPAEGREAVLPATAARLVFVLKENCSNLETIQCAGPGTFSFRSQGYRCIRGIYRALAMCRACRPPPFKVSRVMQSLPLRGRSSRLAPLLRRRLTPLRLWEPAGASSTTQLRKRDLEK